MVWFLGMVKKSKEKKNEEINMNEIQRLVIEETAEAARKRRETHERLKAWASGETILYDEQGKRVSSSP